MRETLITELAEALWHDPNLSRTYRAAMREHQLTEHELTALDRQIMDRTLAAKAAPATTPADDATLPETLEELVPAAPDVSPVTGRRQRQIVPSLLRVQADGHTLDIRAMQDRYGVALQEQGRYQAREELLAQLAWHVERVCPDLTAEAQLAQVRLAANAVGAHVGPRALP